MATRAPISEADNQAILSILQHQGRQAAIAAQASFEVFEKGTEDYVTTVDRALDQALTAAFRQQFPQDAIITEENTQSTGAFHQCHDHLWCIDPIDGTEDFIQGRPNYALMVGLVAQGQPVAGWIHGPTQPCLYWGGPEWGLFHLDAQGQPQPLQPCPPPPPTGEVCPFVLGDRDRRRFGAAIAATAPQLHPYALGSYGLKVMEIIKGQAGLYAYFNGRVRLWDTAGPLALALAAGLVCCDLDGNPIRFDASALYPGTLMHHQPILIGWPDYLERFRAPLREAILQVRQRELFEVPN